MTLQDVATLIMAVATVIYTAGTFLLWWSSRENVRALGEQLHLLDNQLKQQVNFNKVLVNNGVIDAHREIWLAVISNASFLSLLQKEVPNDEERIIAGYLGSIIINHCKRIHSNFEYGISDPADFEVFSRDAKHLFSLPLIKWRWEIVANYHTQEFVKFVDGCIVAAQSPATTPPT